MLTYAKFHTSFKERMIHHRPVQLLSHFISTGGSKKGDKRHYFNGPTADLFCFYSNVKSFITVSYTEQKTKPQITKKEA